MIRLNLSNGASTGLAPAHVRIQNRMVNIQKELFLNGENFELSEYLFLNGKIEIIKIESTKAITPPNLLGIERRIA